ncbi:MAG: hypothetical protein ABSE70_09895 [Candidatus Limnocylindrales bacterium]
MFSMVISTEFFALLKELSGALAAGRTEEAERLDLEVRAAILPVRGPGARMEILGVVAQSLKKDGQFKAALPYFRELCAIGSVHAPSEKNTAYDYRYYAECLRATGDDEEAAEWDEMAAMIGLLHGGL